MLAIRMQRTGRSGHAMFRLIVQDSRMSPTSGKVVEMLGSYDPHAKTTTLNKEKASLYLKNGAQPSPQVAVILKREGVKLPSWVPKPDKKKGKIRNPDKLRRNRPKGAPAPEKAPEPEEAAVEPTVEAEVVSAPAEPEMPAEPEVAPAESETPAATEPEATPEESTEEKSE